MTNWSRENFRENGFMQGDMVLWMIFISLCLISIIEVYSASSNMTYSSGQYWAPVMRHTVFVGLGIAFAWMLHMLPCKFYKLLGIVIMFFSYILLIWAFCSGKINGAARWVGIGDIKFQPSEIAKLGLVTTTAFLLSTFRDKKGASMFGFKIVSANIALTLMLIVTENLSTAAIIFLVMLAICFFAQAPFKCLAWIVGGIAIMGISALFLAKSIPQSTLDEWAKSEGPIHRVPTWVNRLNKNTTLPQDPRQYNITEDIQVTHARIAVGTCGILGKGPGNSVERDYLPHADNDFIYAIIIEEGGIIFGSFVMFLYLLLLYRAYRIANKCKSLFPTYLIMGLALMMVTQAMVNMAVATGAMPVTGQPLPLISRGGTSTFVNCAYIGMMLSVSRSAKMEKDQEDRTETTNNPTTES